MLGVSSAIPSIDFLQVLVSNMGHAFLFSALENEWETLFVDGNIAFEGYCKGGTTLYDT